MQNKSKCQKRVTWDPNVSSPKAPQRCGTCGHRNVKPDFRKIIQCRLCHFNTCVHCLCSGECCMDCNEFLLRQAEQLSTSMPSISSPLAATASLSLSDELDMNEEQEVSPSYRRPEEPYSKVPYSLEDQKEAIGMQLPMLWYFPPSSDEYGVETSECPRVMHDMWLALH